MMLNRIYTYLALAVTVIATGLRTWQLSVAIDQSGFYFPQYETLCGIMGYVTLGIVACFILLGRVALKPKTAVVLPKKNTLLGAAALLLTVASIFQGALDYSSASNDVMGLFSFVACFITAAGFGVTGMCMLQGKTVPFGAAALPVVSHLGYLILQYANFNGISQISENVIFILFICAFLAFTLTHCRVISGVDSPKGVAFGYGTAAATALFGFCASVPHWIMGQNQYPLSFIGFGAGLYALVYLFSLPHLESKEG